MRLFPMGKLRFLNFLIKNLIISWYLQWQLIAKESTWERFPSNSKSCLFFTYPVCHEAGIWNFDKYVSTCIEVVISVVELQNIQVRNLRYYISNSAQNIGLRNASSVLPWPIRILSYPVNFIDRGNRTKPASMSKWFWLYNGTKPFPWN